MFVHVPVIPNFAPCGICGPVTVDGGVAFSLSLCVTFVWVLCIDTPQCLSESGSAECRPYLAGSNGGVGGVETLHGHSNEGPQTVVDDPTVRFPPSLSLSLSVC